MVDGRHIGQLVVDFLKSICDNWFVIVFFIGIGLLLAEMFVSELPHKDEVKMLGSTIIFSSVFASFTRWLSVRGIVKSTLNEILSSKEFLKKEDNFDKTWNTLVEVAIDKHNPSLKGILEDSSVRKYIPQEGELFYRSYSQDLVAEWADKPNRLVKVTETTKITVNTKDNKPHDLAYQFKASMPIGANWNYKIEDLKVDTQCLNKKIKVGKPQTNNLSGEDEVTISYKLELRGATEYRIHRVMTREISLDFEPYIIVVSGKHTLKPEVSFTSNDGIKATFNSTGTLDEFDTIAGRNNSVNFSERHPGLMLKGQGYIICLND